MILFCCASELGPPEDLRAIEVILYYYYSYYDYYYIQPQRRHRGKKLIMRLNVTKLSDKSLSEDLTRELDCKLAELHLGQTPRQTG